MPKSAKARSKARRGDKFRGRDRNMFPRMDLLTQLVSVFAGLQNAPSIVADVLVHFGAGYGAEIHYDTGSTGAPAFTPIFKRPSDLNTFHTSLLESTSRHLAELNWATNAPL